MHTPDTSINQHGVGNKTNTNYRKFVVKYKKLLLTTTNRTRVKALIKWYNTIIFNDSVAADKSAPTHNYDAEADEAEEGFANDTDEEDTNLDEFSRREAVDVLPRQMQVFEMAPRPVPQIHNVTAPAVTEHVLAASSAVAGHIFASDVHVQLHAQDSEDGQLQQLPSHTFMDSGPHVMAAAGRLTNVPRDVPVQVAAGRRRRVRFSEGPSTAGPSNIVVPMALSIPADIPEQPSTAATKPPARRTRVTRQTGSSKGKGRAQ